VHGALVGGSRGLGSKKKYEGIGASSHEKKGLGEHELRMWEALGGGLNVRARSEHLSGGNKTVRGRERSFGRNRKGRGRSKELTTLERR